MSTETVTTLDNIKNKTKEFLFRFIRKDGLKDDEDYFAQGMINSLFAMQLVMFVEKEFKIKVENEDLDLKNFRTINAVGDFIMAKLNT